MTTQAVATPHVRDAATDESRSQRLLALSGIAFVGAIALVTWTATTSVSTYRKVTAAIPTATSP